MASKLWSSRMLSGWSNSSSVRHYCVVLFVVCHWHKYVFLMACAPHLSFLVVVFSFIILCMAVPSIRFGVGLRFCVWLFDVWGFSWGMFCCVWGNNICAC